MVAVDSTNTFFRNPIYLHYQMALSLPKVQRYARHNREYDVFLHEPFFVDSLNGTVFGGKPVDENRGVKSSFFTLGQNLSRMKT